MQAEKMIVFTDYGISIGMDAGIANALKLNLPIEYRTIGKNPQQGE